MVFSATQSLSNLWYFHTRPSKQIVTTVKIKEPDSLPLVSAQKSLQCSSIKTNALIDVDMNAAVQWAPDWVNHAYMREEESDLDWKKEKKIEDYLMGMNANLWNDF